MDAVTTAKTLDLLTRTLCGRFDMPAGLVGADKMLSALCTVPPSSDGVLLETFEILLSRLDVLDMSQGDEN